jgi:hypothetical protein
VKAMEAATSSLRFMGINVVLWKFICRPVALAKESRVCLRCKAEGDAWAMMRLSLAYWRTAGAMSFLSGCRTFWYWKSSLISCCRISEKIMYR